LRLRAMLSVRGGDDAEAIEYCERSIGLARQQSARAWELRSTLELAQLLAGTERAAEGRARLAEVYGRFSEGFDTPDLVAARALLGG
jgi:hypothetical protein